MPPIWLRTDEWGDIASSLDALQVALARVPARPGAWKWVILAAHSAFQGALVCVLKGSTEIGHLDEPSQRRMLRWLDDTRTKKAPRPKERIAELPILVIRAQDPKCMNDLGGKPLHLGAAEQKAIALLHEFRNDFTHFRPQSWSIALHDLPKVTHTVTAITKTLMLGHPASVGRLSSYQCRIFRKRFALVSAELKRLGCQRLPRATLLA